MAHAVSGKKRRAQSKVVEMILPEQLQHQRRRVSLNVYFLGYRTDSSKVA